MQNPLNQPKTSWLWIISLMSIILLSIICFVPAMTGMAIWDDHSLIGGPGIGGGDTLEHCFTKPFLFHYFRPIVSISFFIEHKISGSGPIFYHSTNILIHAITTAVLVAMLLLYSIGGASLCLADSRLPFSPRRSVRWPG